MKTVVRFRAKLPTLKNSSLAILSAILLVLAFPNFELWFLAFVACVPLFYAVNREKDSAVKGFALGWMFGTIFFFGSCWWLAYPMYTYAGFPKPLAYLFVLLAFLLVGLFPAVFAGLLSILLKRFGTSAIFAAPFLWTATEFLRFNLTGNNWNAIAYSQAFQPFITKFASVGGIYLVGFILIYANVIFSLLLLNNRSKSENYSGETGKQKFLTLGGQYFFPVVLPVAILASLGLFINQQNSTSFEPAKSDIKVVAIQPNVPMKGLKLEDWERLRARHVQLTEQVLQSEQLKNNQQPLLVIFPESPMNFEYTRDPDFQDFVRDFTTKHQASILFNAAEPAADDGILNSAVLVSERGAKIAQYDKIHLVPFGEFVPLPDFMAQYIPTVAGNFEFGKSYDLMPLGDLQFGTMICFESHFPTLSRRFALEGADALVEMTNDGYLGDTGVLRQHLASAVFRAVETNRPVLRVTNVGITAYINERGKVLDATKAYTEDARLWSISKSDGAQTFYVRYGDWVAWLSVSVSVGLLIFGFWRKKTRKTIETTI